MGAFENAINKIVASAGESFLERFVKDAINDSVCWAENTSGNPADYLDNVCHILLLERGLGMKLINRAFCDLQFLDDADAIIQDFGLENVEQLLKDEKKSCNNGKMNGNALATLIVSKHLPGSARVAEYVIAEIQTREDWKSIVNSYSEMEDA